MSADATTGCTCELCQPNYYMGWDGGFTPEPETPPVNKQEKAVEKPDAKPDLLVPALAN